MQFSNVGKLVAWLGISLFAVGLVLTSIPIIVMVGSTFAVLFVGGLYTRRKLNSAASKIRIVGLPKEIDTSVEWDSKIIVRITNNGKEKSRVSDLRLADHDELIQQKTISYTAQPPAEREQVFQIAVRPTLMGKYEVRPIIIFEGPLKLFKHQIKLPDKITIFANPKRPNLAATSLTWLNLDAMNDIRTDPNRRGPGTDLAGIRPYAHMDDLHRIDWKATARNGRLMTRDYFIERDPPIMLMIEISERFREMSPAIKEEIEQLIYSIPDANPMGCILYDTRGPIVSLPPELGLRRRKDIVKALLETPEENRACRGADGAIRPYFDLTRQTKTPTDAAKTRTSPKLRSFLAKTLPFYKAAASTYFRRVNQLGVFKAFTIIRDLSQPMLVISIYAGNTNFAGMFEGTRTVAMVNCRVIIAVLNGFIAPELVRALGSIGARVLECGPGELSKSITDAIRDSTHLREIRTELQT